MFEFFTKATSPLTIGLITALAVTLFLNRSLSRDLDEERAEKAKALLIITSLEQSLDKIKTVRNADNQAAKGIFKHMELYNELNTSTALTIASIPSFERDHAGKKAKSKTPSTKSKAAKNGSKKIRQYEEAGSCPRKSNSSSCGIDVPLPELSAPLVLLYNKLSNATGGSSSPSLAYGNKTSAHSASKGADRPTAGSVGKGTSRNIR